MDRDVEIMRYFCPRQVCRKKSQDAQFAAGELIRVRWRLSVGAWRRRVSQLVNDVSEKGAVGCLVVTEFAEQLRGFGHGKREDQPVGLSGREGCLGGRCRGVSIAQAQVRGAARPEV